MSDVPSSAYLESENQATGKKYPLSADRAFRIGRNQGNNIVLNDDLASRNHAILQSSGSVYHLTDLGSTNGTLVNGSRVTASVRLRPGDRIQIGNHSFIFHQEAYESNGDTEEEATSLMLSMRLISVLVVDIRDFTGLTQRLGSERLGELAGALFRESGESLYQHGAWAQKYIGDSVMAVWLHRSLVAEISELNPVFEALLRVRAIAEGLQVRFGLTAPVRIGAGVNTGPASIGNFGSSAASDHTALGDVVNKAFRLEAATKDIGCDLVLGEDTFKLIAASDAAQSFTACVTKLKGYDQPATVYAAKLSSLEEMLGSLQKRQAPTRSSY